MGKKSIIQEIHKHLDRLSKKKSFRDGEKKQKTIHVKTALCRAVKTALGDTPDLRICARGVDEQDVVNREWLYDVACLKYSGGNDEGWIWPIKRVPMVAECEWGRKRAICNDFDKLVVARADVRVMVYDGDKFPYDEDDFETLKGLIGMRRTSRFRDTYLLASWREYYFEYRTITVS